MASQLPRSQVPTSSVLDPRRILDMNYAFASTAITAEAFFARRVRDLFPLVHPVAKRAAAIVALEVREQSPFHLFDVGAGSAPWSAAFALHYPFALVTALDLPSVVEQGRQQVAEMGLKDRYTE